MSTSSGSRPSAERERRDLIRKWENTHSPNPEFKGATPKQVARKLPQIRTETRLTATEATT